MDSNRSTHAFASTSEFGSKVYSYEDGSARGGYRMMPAQHLLLAAAVLATSLVFADEDTDESKASKKLVLLGAQITRDESLPGRPVTGVNFWADERFNDKYMHLLKSFPSLTTLDVRFSKSSDAGLKEIAQ